MILNRKTVTHGTLGLLAVLFVALALLSNTLFRGARLDLTENSLYTLSQGTRNILAKLDEPIHLTLYFSDKATAESGRADVRNLRVYYERVRELLEEMASRASGKLRLDVVDPCPIPKPKTARRPRGFRGFLSVPRAKKSSSDWSAPIPPTAGRQFRSSIPARNRFSNTSWPS